MESNNLVVGQTETVIDSVIIESIPEVVQLTETDLFGFQFMSEFSEVAAPEERPIKIADYIAFKAYGQFDETFKGYQKSSMTSFCTCCISKDFRKDVTLKDLLIESKRNGSSVPYVRWEISGDMPIPFLGYPFLILGSSRFQCSQGKDMNVSNKEKFRRLRDANNEPSAKRNLSRPTKKMGCPVLMFCKKVIVFPSLTVPKDTKHNRSICSSKMRKAFEKYVKDVEEGKPVDENFGTLLYLTKFPDPSTHQFHLEFSNSLSSSLGTTSKTEQPADDNGIFLGASFASVRKMEEAILKYKIAKNARLFADMKDIALLKPKTRLIYESVTYKCMHVISSKHKVKKGRTFKQGCEMHIRFGVSDDGSQLVVKSMSELHNHEINEETVVKEALHPDLCVYVSKLVWHDMHITIDDVKARLEDYVLSVMFKELQPPPRTRRQYFPSKKQIRYFMAKAKASLNISPEAEQKLELQVDRLKQARHDEKLVYNFRVQNSSSGFDMSNEESMEEDLAGSQSSGALNEQQNNAKVLFCHQTPHQQRIMRRYNTQVILTQISDLHSKIPFPLFCLYVQTNVDFQLVASFICQANEQAMISEGLQIIKEWNPGWNPKFIVVDFEEQQITAVESVFQGSFALVSDLSREHAWNEWLNMESNGVSEFKEDVIKYLDAIAFSYSEETLNKAARELEESDVWKMSDKMRNWFQINWLAQAKRWVAGYRPDDYLMATHIGRTLDDDLKIFKTVKLGNKSSPLQDLIQQLVEHIVPVSKKQYELYNKESFRLQNELFYLSWEIPNYLSNRPGKLTEHIYERLKTAASRNFYITDIHPGIFSVQGCEGPDDHIHTISFGDNTSYPSCDCEDWQRFKLPCVHFAAVYNTYSGWTWDMMGNPYRTNPIFNADWSVISPDLRVHNPGFLNDVATQTTGANLITTCVPDFSLTKINDQRRVTETPQVMASQCRGLLQQLSKLQLAHHSKDSLYRLRSELKELISIFSAAPKTKILFPMSTVPLKGRKQGLVNNQSVFEQYNVKLVTPKQVTLNKMDVGASTVQEQTSDVDSDDDDSDDDEVDGMYISTVGEEQIVEENEESQQQQQQQQQQQVIMTIPNISQSTTSSAASATSSLKRIQEASRHFLKEDGTEDEPAYKKFRSTNDDRGGKEMLNASQNITVKQIPVEEGGGGEVVVEAVDAANVMQFPSNTTLSTVIDGQTISISLDQVAAMSAKVNNSEVDGGGQEILTFTTTSVAGDGETLISSGETVDNSEHVQKHDTDTSVK